MFCLLQYGLKKWVHFRMECKSIMALLNLCINGDIDGNFNAIVKLAVNDTLQYINMTE